MKALRRLSATLVLGYAMIGGCADVGTSPRSDTSSSGQAGNHPNPTSSRAAHVFSGAEADSMASATAARWAALGDDRFKHALERDAAKHSAAIAAFAARQKHSTIAASLLPAGDPVLDNWPTPALFPTADILATSTSPTAYLAEGAVTSAVTLFGTHGANTITASAVASDGFIIRDAAAFGRTSGLTPEANNCMLSFLTNPMCSWTGTYMSGVLIDLGSRKCGVTITARADHEAWWELPSVSISAGHYSFGTPSVRWGDAAPVGGSNTPGGNQPCIPPNVHFSKSGGGSSANDGGTLTLPFGGSSVSFSSSSTSGAAALSQHQWLVDGSVQGGSTSWSGGISATGSHTIALNVTDAAGLIGIASATIVVRPNEDECSDATLRTSPGSRSTLNRTSSFFSAECDHPCDDPFTSAIEECGSGTGGGSSTTAYFVEYQYPSTELVCEKWHYVVTVGGYFSSEYWELENCHEAM
ncbi:MAG: hypothetical protein V4550_00180 [Gemmatimonadota bacterium]